MRRHRKVGLREATIHTRHGEFRTSLTEIIQTGQLACADCRTKESRKGILSGVTTKFRKEAGNALLRAEKQKHGQGPNSSG